ncbi:MAG: hypothetical protein IJW37_04585 [Lachnospiraceae bacterium]|nr:hypothetical protein [Lachnospiraceae bacterium]
MKYSITKHKLLFLLAIVVVCGCAGCKKAEDNIPMPTPTKAATPTAAVSPTSAVTPTPTVTPTPEPVTFPVEISETTFPEQLLRKKALAADGNEDGVLSREEAETVTKLHLKKLADEDSKDALEDEPLPEYTVADFTFDFEGIQYFTELSELTVNLLGGEAFVPGEAEEIHVSTKNFRRVYECTKLKKLALYEVDITLFDLSAFSSLKRLELNCMYNLETVCIGTHEKLSALWISECHKLETIDLSGAESIKTVDIVRNDRVKELLFGEANGKLETIQLNGLGNLHEADFSDLRTLKSLNLTDVSLTSLDVSKNAALEQLCAEGLCLDTLDLSNNPNISYLINATDSFRSILLPEDNCISMIRWTDSVVTEFPMTNLNPETLTGIDIQGTAIKELDVSPYPNLVHLYYDENVTKIKR